MNDLKYTDTISHLFEAVPNIKTYYNSRVKDLYANNNPHVVYGSIFVEYINSAANDLGGSLHNLKDQTLKECFSLIEDLSSSSDFQTRCLVETSVIEALLGEKGGLERYARYMGLETKGIAREIARGWGLNIELLS